MSSAVTLPCHACVVVVSVGAPVPAPIVRTPQLPSWLPTTAEPPIPVTPVPVKSPVPPVASAVALTFASTRCTVTSPPNSDRSVTSADALDVAVWEGSAAALDVTEPLVSTLPSSGYEKPAPKPTESLGAATEPAIAPGWFGTMIFTANACAVARLRSGADDPAEGPTARRATPRTRATTS